MGEPRLQTVDFQLQDRAHLSYLPKDFRPLPQALLSSECPSLLVQFQAWHLAPSAVINYGSFFNKLWAPWEQDLRFSHLMHSAPSAEACALGCLINVWMNTHITGPSNTVGIWRRCYQRCSLLHSSGLWSPCAKSVTPRPPSLGPQGQGLFSGEGRLLSVIIAIICDLEQDGHQAF